MKWLLTLLLTVVVAGFFWPRFTRRTRLPGDVTLRLRGRDYAFPFTSALLLSALATLLFRLL